MITKNIQKLSTTRAIAFVQIAEYYYKYKVKHIAFYFTLHTYMRKSDGNFLKIGQLARLANVLPSTVHYYTKEGLLKYADETQGGYRLYAKRSALARIKEIQSLQNNKRLTITELKKKFRK